MASDPVHAERVRHVIAAALKDLALLDLSNFEQTTHGKMPGLKDIAEVCDCLKRCWNNPTAFNISELSQAIAALPSE